MCVAFSRAYARHFLGYAMARIHRWSEVTGNTRAILNFVWSWQTTVQYIFFGKLMVRDQNGRICARNKKSSTPHSEYPQNDNNSPIILRYDVYNKKNDSENWWREFEYWWRESEYWWPDAKFQYLGDENLIFGDENTKIGDQNSNIGDENLNLGDENLNLGDENRDQKKGCSRWARKLIFGHNLQQVLYFQMIGSRAPWWNQGPLTGDPRWPYQAAPMARQVNDVYLQICQICYQ